MNLPFKCHCNRCHADWNSYTGHPKSCSKCRSVLWDEEKGYLESAELRLSMPERFEKYVVKKDGCWDWTGRFDKDGYPILMIKQKPFTVRCNRLSWSIKNGPIPEGLLVLHHCDNPCCTNPNHLYTGTFQNNSDDMVSRQRSLPGEKHPNSTLNWETVRAIRREYVGNYGQQTRLAKKYGTSQANVSAIVKNKVWKLSNDPAHACPAHACTQARVD